MNRTRCSRRSGRPAWRNRAAGTSRSQRRGTSRVPDAGRPRFGCDELGLEPTSRLGRRSSLKLASGRGRGPGRAGIDSWTRGCPSTPREGTVPTAWALRGCRPIFTSVKSVSGRSGPLSGRGQHGRPTAGQSYLRELGWREFAHHLLFHFPHTPEQPLRENFADFPWEHDAERPACLAARADRLPHRRRGHARAVADGLDAQSRADDRGLVPRQGLTDSLARMGRPGSGTRWSMPTWRTTPWAGSGRPVAAPMPPPISASSTR